MWHSVAAQKRSQVLLPKSWNCRFRCFDQVYRLGSLVQEGLAQVQKEFFEPLRSLMIVMEWLFQMRRLLQRRHCIQMFYNTKSYGRFSSSVLAENHVLLGHSELEGLFERLDRDRDGRVSGRARSTYDYTQDLVG